MQDLCRLVSERIHLLPPFRWRLAPVPLDIDLPYWIEDPDFDLDFHIRESAVPPPGTREQIANTVARIVARPLDRAHPLWELYLVHGLPDGRVGVVSKIHHAAVDGMSGAEILSVLLDLGPGGRDVPPPAPERPDEAPSQLGMLARGVAGLPRQPLRALSGLPRTLQHLPAVPGMGAVPGSHRLGRLVGEVSRRLPGPGDGGLLEPVAVRAPRTRFNARISPHRRFAYGTLSLDRIKAIKNALGITVNDVVVALCATALREWLLERDELPDEALVAMIPLSVRTRAERGTFGNRISMMFVPIPTDVPDPRQRLERAHEVLRAAKERFSAVPADLLQDVTRFVPPAVLARASRLTAQLGGIQRLRPLNLVISNVPGARLPLYLAGARMEAHYPVSVITDGVGLNITCMSYLDNVDVGIVADAEQLDDAWPLMDGLERALDELHDAVADLDPGRRTIPA